MADYVKIDYTEMGIKEDQTLIEGARHELNAYHSATEFIACKETV